MMGFRRPGRASALAIALGFVAALSAGPSLAQGTNVHAGVDVSGRYPPAVESDETDMRDSSYLDGVRNAISREWTDSRKTPAPPVVRFDVSPDGSISGLQLETSSGIMDLDRHAIDAVTRAAPFAPPPAVVRDGRLRLHVLFPPHRFADRARDGIWAAARFAAAQHLTGVSGRRDPSRAVLMLTDLAEQGDLQAMTDLGFAYEHGAGLDRDTARAASWYRRAADWGSGVAQFHLARLYEKGDGVERDERKAFSLYRAATGSEHPQVAKDARQAIARLMPP